jgi:hypothetical protein
MVDRWRTFVLFYNAVQEQDFTRKLLRERSSLPPKNKRVFESEKLPWHLPVRIYPFILTNDCRSTLTSSTLYEPGPRATVIVAFWVYIFFGFPFALLVLIFCFGTFEVFEEDTVQEYFSYSTPGLDSSLYHAEGLFRYYRLTRGRRWFRRVFF